MQDKNMDELIKRYREAFVGVVSYWRLSSKGFNVLEVQQLAGQLYRVKATLFLWEAFTFDTLYIDGNSPCVFIDAYMLSHFTEFLIKNRTE